MSTESELIKEVSKGIHQIDNLNTFDVNESLKHFQGLGVTELNIANSEIASHLHKRFVVRQRETERSLVCIANKPAKLTLDLCFTKPYGVNSDFSKTKIQLLKWG